MKRWLSSALSILLVVVAFVPAVAGESAITSAGSNIDLSVKVIGKTGPDH